MFDKLEFINKKPHMSKKKLIKNIYNIIKYKNNTIES